MNNHLISVIIPIYNLEEYLGATVESVMAQTHSQLEIILVDDGSTDGSLALMRSYAERDERVKVISKPNGGVSSARNAGLDVATGEYIGFIDGDDIPDADMYEYLLDGAVRYSADVVQCGVMKDGEPVCAPKGELAVRDRHALSQRGIDKLLAGGVWCKLYRAKLARDIRFDERFPIGEDLFYTLHALDVSRCTVFLPECKYNYVTRTGSALNAERSEEKLTSYRRMLSEATSLFGASRAVARYLKRENLRNNADMCSQIVRSGKTELEELYREIRKEVRKNIGTVLFGSGLEPKMRVKLLLLAYFDRAYRRGVLRSHGEK